jgi:hypothetical protein
MRPIIIFYCLLCVMLLPASLYAQKGDLNADGVVDLSDVVIALGTTSGINTDIEFDISEIDVNADNRIGLAEAIHGFEVAAGLRSAESFEYVLDVGPGQTYPDPSDVPWESIQPGTLIRIHYRSEPYAHKWVIDVTASENAPVVVRGIPEGNALPVISGMNAVTRLQLSYWNENRSVVKIGGSNHNSIDPSYVVVENLEICSGRPSYTFTNDNGTNESYINNAAAIHIEEGNNITIRNCRLRDCGNGLFVTSLASNVLVEGNYIYDNGMEGRYYEHNSYTSANGIIFQYNHYGPLRNGCLGNNLKDRSAGTVIRYNWIETGSRTLDLVDADSTDILSDLSYRTTMVYGNILTKTDIHANSQVVHYGGDSGNTENYRKGVLWFFNNTIISTRDGNTTMLRLSSGDETAQCFNNLIYNTAEGARMAILDSSGTVQLYNNLLPVGWRNSHGTLTGTINNHDNIEADDPSFTDFSNTDYSLAPGSVCVNAGITIPSELLPDDSVKYQYVKHQGHMPRPSDGSIDIGAFER